VPSSAAARRSHRQVAIVSTESIASPSPPAGAAEPCLACGAPLADDQRYCLECGERRFPMSSVLLGGPAVGAKAPPDPEGTPPPPATSPADGAGRGNAVTVIAGVGVLLLAMGVGVLIGRSGSSGPSVAPAAQVISVASTPASGAGGATVADASSFTSDWPSGTNGYTVQLQTLPESSTQVSAVEAAKSAASAKGATGVGALKSNEFSSLKAGSYVIYAGVYHKKSDAEKARASARKNFPDASVIKVANGAEGSSPGASGASSGGSGVGASEKHPAPPSVVDSLKTTKGKSYEEQSKNLPNVISTG
jgi:hypothetical protein